MAAVVRVKRRLDQDPANSLLLSCKRFKSGDTVKNENIPDVSEIKTVFKFAGTLKSKETDVQSHVREAIKREKLQKEYKRHVVDITNRARHTQLSCATKNRFKVVSSLRLLHATSQDDKSKDGVEEKPYTSQDTGHQGDKTRLSDNKGSLSALAESHNHQIHVPELEHENVDQAASSVFSLFDIEAELTSQESNLKLDPSPVESIMCNGIPLIREPATPSKQSTLGSDGYVYDIYYMNSPEFDFRNLENILAIEALREDLVCEEQGRRDSEDEYGEDEDSNDEGNWRNDYPDEEEEIFGDAITFGSEGKSEDEDQSTDDDYTHDFGISHLVGKRLKICDEDDVDEDGDDDVYQRRMLEDVYRDYDEMT